jgi:peptidoglycan/LPS O-acetylase OafA/YrhL
MLDPIGMSIGPQWDIEHNHQHATLRVLLSVLFLGQSWNLTVTPLSNGPYWSLCHEVWYYVIFGIIAFDTNRTRRIGLACAAAMIAGPRILLMSTVWLVGLAFYRLTKHVAPKGILGLILFVAAVANVAQILVWTASSRKSGRIASPETGLHDCRRLLVYGNPAD